MLDLVIWHRASGRSTGPFSRELSERLSGYGAYVTLGVALILWLSPGNDRIEGAVLIAVLSLAFVIAAFLRLRAR